MAVIIVSTHFVYTRRDGQAELARVAGYMQRWFTGFEDGRSPIQVLTGPGVD